MMAKKLKAKFCELPVASLTTDQNIRHNDAELDALAASIGRVGMLHPIVCSDSAGTIVAGTSRLAAAKRAGLDKVPVIIRPDLADPERRALARFEENTRRKPLTANELHEATVLVKPMFDREAEKRQKASRAKPGQRIGAGSAQGGARLVPPMARKPRKLKVIDQVGATLGVSGESIRKNEAVHRAASEDPARYGHLLEIAAGHSVDAAYHELKRLTKPNRPHGERGQDTQEARMPDPPPIPLLPNGPPGDDPRAAALEGKVRGLCFDLGTIRARAEKFMAAWAASLTDAQLDRLRAEAAAILDALGGRDPEMPVESPCDTAPL